MITEQAECASCVEYIPPDKYVECVISSKIYGARYHRVREKGAFLEMDSIESTKRQEQETTTQPNCFCYFLPPCYE